MRDMFRSLTGALTAVAASLVGCAGADEAERVDYTTVIEFWDFGPDRTPVVGADVCVDQPEGECETTDEAGSVTLRVPEQSRVLLRVEHPELFPTLVPIVVGPAAGGRVDNVAPYSVNIVEAVAAILGMTADPALGHVTLGAEPASDANRGEVVTVIEPDGGAEGPRTYYLGEDNLPDVEATSTPSTGNALAANVPPGDWALDTSFAERCEVVRGWRDMGPDGQPIIRFPVRAGHVTLTLVTDCTAP